MSSDGFGPLLSMCVVEFPVGMTQCLDFLVCYGLLLPVSAGENGPYEDLGNGSYGACI